MEQEPSVGDLITIAADVFIGDQPAFKRGEKAVLYDIRPDATRPQYRYIVFSKTLGNWLALSKDELESGDYPNDLSRPEEVGDPPGGSRGVSRPSDPVEKLFAGTAIIEILLGSLGIVSLLIGIVRFIQSLGIIRESGFFPSSSIDDYRTIFIVVSIAFGIFSIILLVAGVKTVRGYRKVTIHIVLGAIIVTFAVLGVIVNLIRSRDTSSLALVLLMRLLPGGLILGLGLKIRTMSRGERAPASLDVSLSD
ncbi:MAG: hypothetical protein V1748_03780 [Actinomycetota bacterium]